VELHDHSDNGIREGDPPFVSNQRSSSLPPDHSGPIPVVGNDYAVARRELADRVRDIFGNPFRPVRVDPSWRTTDAVALARGIYAERAFDRLPILADALEDAGCTNAGMLTHCRAPGPHVGGCWVIDLVLAKG
jgi:hypothetical protein